jgi:hypothetical protein
MPDELIPHVPDGKQAEWYEAIANGDYTAARLLVGYAWGIRTQDELRRWIDGLEMGATVAPECLIGSTSDTR